MDSSDRLVEETVDFLEMFSHLYGDADGRISVVNVPTFPFLSCKLSGSPFSGRCLDEAARALRRVSLGMQLAARDASILDYRAMPLECLWGEGECALMVMIPAANQALFEQELDLVRREFKSACGQMQLIAFHEGLSVQISAVRPAASDLWSREALEEFARAQGYRTHGLFHTIYLGDPRNAAQKMRVVARIPVVPV